MNRARRILRCYPEQCVILALAFALRSEPEVAFLEETVSIFNVFFLLLFPLLIGIPREGAEVAVTLGAKIKLDRRLEGLDRAILLVMLEFCRHKPRSGSHTRLDVELNVECQS